MPREHDETHQHRAIDAQGPESRVVPGPLKRRGFFGIAAVFAAAALAARTARAEEGGQGELPPEDADKIDVRTFGAAGDGVVDDAPSFQAAVLAVAGTGLSLFISPGLYKIGA